MPLVSFDGRSLMIDRFDSVCPKPAYLGVDLVTLAVAELLM